MSINFFPGQKHPAPSNHDTPTKRKKIETSTIARIVINGESEWTNKNCVGLNKEQVKWVRLANHVYPVEPFIALGKEEILLTPEQRDLLSKNIFTHDHHSCIMATNMKVLNFPIADNVELSVKPMDGNTKPISLTELRDAILQYVNTAVLSAGRSFFFCVGERRFLCEVVKWDPQTSTLVQLNEKTELILAIKEIPVYDQVYELHREDKICISLHFDQSFKKKEYPSTLVLQRDAVWELMKQHLQSFLKHDEFKMSFEGLSVTCKIDKVKRSEKMKGDNLYKFKYGINQACKYKLDEKALHPYIQFAQGEGAASSMVIEIENKSQNKQKKPRLSMELLKNYLFDHSFIIGQRLKLHILDIGDFYLRVTDLEQGKGEKKNLHRKFSESSELDIVSKGDDIHLVDNECLYFLSQITLTVEKSDSTTLPSFQKEKLEEKVRKVVGNYVFENQSINIKLHDSNGVWTTLKLKVKHRKFESQTPTPVKYGWTGIVVDSTKIAFELSKNSLSFHQESKEVGLSLLSEVVGGVSDQLKDLMREVILSRGPLREEFERRGKKANQGNGSLWPARHRQNHSGAKYRVHFWMRRRGAVATTQRL